MKRTLLIIISVAGLQILSAAQSSAPEATPAPTQSDTSARTAPAAPVSAPVGMQPDVDATDTSSTLPQIPALLGGIGITPAFLTELERSNFLRAGINVGATYDDNPLLQPAGATSNTSESVFPNIRIDESTSRIRWTLGYAGGLTVNQKIASQNEGSHNVNFDSQVRLSPHVNLRVAENFAMTTGFFDAGNGNQAISGAGGPNTSLITPLATQRSSVTTVETNYHFALNDLVGASGSFYDLHFTNIPATSGLLTDSETAAASAFWLHHVVRGDWAGISYRFDRIAFNPSGETRAHSFLAMNTLNVSKRVTLTGFAGPQYNENQGLGPNGAPPSTNHWSLAGGAEGVWRDQRTSFTAGYSRTVSDGGGLSGAVRLQSSYGTFRREIATGWTVSLGANHGNNQALTVPSITTASTIDFTSAGVSLERNTGKSIGFRLGYTHDFQQQLFAPAALSPELDAHRNLFYATLSYQWSKPLGM